MKHSRHILVVTALIGLASSAAAQIQVTDATNPFRDFDRSTSLQSSSTLSQPPMLSLPTAMPVRRPLKLRPAKPILVLEGSAANDGELGRLHTRRHDILRDLKVMRKQQDQAGAVDLVRQLEEVRLARIVRLRAVATPKAPEKPKMANPEPGLSQPEVPTVPVLPIPSGPK
ncbi:MAG: hypothetical protein KDB53_00020 [Planctomycetes bacterium]|nr:hypothetical protein [Planctomycetota bacterium]